MSSTGRPGAAAADAADNGGWPAVAAGQQQQQQAPSATVETVDLLSSSTTSSGTEDSDDLSGSEQDAPSWISWFTGLKGNEFFCDVDEDYVEDDFNLAGLSTQVRTSQAEHKPR